MSENQQKLELNLSARSALKIFLYIIAGYLLYNLLPFFMIVFLAILIAVTLEPLVIALEKWHLNRGISALIIVVFCMGMLALFVVFVLPPLFHQLASMAQGLPSYREKLESSHPFGGILKKAFASISSPAFTAGISKDPSSLLAAGQITLGALAGFGLMLALSIYLVLDGPAAYRWCLHFFSESTRKKMDATSDEASKLIFAYVAGQAITSLLAAAYAFTVLKVLDVPAALTLAVLAGIFDILPIIGFFIFTIPAVVLALTVSPFTALMVLLCYSFYQIVESYLVIPRVYGNRLRLSDLTVLAALTVASIIAGIPGAIAILPVVAAYPMIEKIWLKEYLPAQRASSKHS